MSTDKAGKSKLACPGHIRFVDSVGNKFLLQRWREYFFSGGIEIASWLCHQCLQKKCPSSNKVKNQSHLIYLGHTRFDFCLLKWLSHGDQACFVSSTWWHLSRTSISFNELVFPVFDVNRSGVEYPYHNNSKLLKVKISFPEICPKIFKNNITTVIFKDIIYQRINVKLLFHKILRKKCFTMDPYLYFFRHDINLSDNLQFREMPSPLDNFLLWLKNHSSCTYETSS